MISAWPDLLSDPVAPLAAAALLLCLGWWSSARLAAWRRARRVARTRRLGARGEARAETLLARAGYSVIERQAAGEVAVVVDGERGSFAVRVDFLVSRRGRRYAAEAKGGAAASSLANRATRRQLLEYAHVFDVDGVLLVDAYRDRVRRVEFPRASRTEGPGQS